jgi:hypothetical protein
MSNGWKNTVSPGFISRFSHLIEEGKFLKAEKIDRK